MVSGAPSRVINTEQKAEAYSKLKEGPVVFIRCLETVSEFPSPFGMFGFDSDTDSCLTTHVTFSVNVKQFYTRNSSHSVVPNPGYFLKAKHCFSGTGQF